MSRFFVYLNSTHKLLFQDMSVVQTFSSDNSSCTKWYSKYQLLLWSLTLMQPGFGHFLNRTRTVGFETFGNLARLDIPLRPNPYSICYLFMSRRKSKFIQVLTEGHCQTCRLFIPKQYSKVLLEDKHEAIVWFSTMINVMIHFIVK